MKPSSLIREPDFRSALDKADPELLWRSVAGVMASYYTHHLQPGAEKWQSDTRIWRPKLIGDITAEWSHHTGTDVVFPWHDDYVLEVWVKFRKLTKDLKRDHWQHFHIVLPPQWTEATGED